MQTITPVERNPVEGNPLESSHPLEEKPYKVSTTYDRTVVVQAFSLDDARVAGESRVITIMKSEGVRFAASRVRAVFVEALAA